MSTPIMMSSCARAATAQEAAYRINYPLAYARATRVVAFDAVAERVVNAVSQQGPWGEAQFYRASPTGEELITVSGERRAMESEIEHSDSVILVATNAIEGDAVAAVGMACRERSIMTAGMLLLEGSALEGSALEGSTLLAIRPHARILLVPADQEDLLQLLRAIRA
ncbi:hypothetical protein [Cryobacterium sp. N21]|uniref:hypothetical protein n=1 Tax=Cryobacterium sp. N21 TaxID=2048289 RepID=UPI000CE30995|nr:hypothetical protein [Cryobacterium sp. N21]